MADPCAAQLTAANSCVSGDPGSCSCFTQPFMTSFPTEVTGAYRKTMAFEVPGSPEFCTKANFNVCTQFETTAGCCCGKEITEYTKCTFTSTLNVNFGAVGCEHTSCGGGGEEAAGGGGGSMMIIVVILLLLGCGCGGFYYRRRKRLASLVGKDVDTRESGKTDDSWDGDRDLESGDRNNFKSKKGGFDSDSESDSDCSKDKKKKDKRSKLTKKSSKKGVDSESESDDSDFSGRGKKKKDKRSKLTTQSSKKGFDSESESDESDFSGRGKKKTDKHGKPTKKSSKRGNNSESDSDDSEYAGKKKGKLVRRNSKKNLVESDSESSEDSERNNKKAKKKKGGSRRGHTDSESESSDNRPMKGRANKATDQSVRQARTILTSYSTTKDQNISSQVQTAMKSEMTDVIATMKAQREVMEERLREAERAAIKLRLEQESSRKQITELETKKQETENILQETQMEAKLVRSSSCLELAEKEGEKILVSAELEGVRKERENMSKMIKNLEKAKQDMEGRLSQAKEETTTLKAQNEESTKRVTEVEKDRETMKLKLAQLQTTRGTIEARLKEAEEEGIQLKEERNEKSKQIKRCDNDDDIHQYQNQKDTISRELKKLESERVEMMTMVERLNKSCDNVQGQIGVSRHSIMGMDGSLNSSHVMSNSTREFTSYRPSQRCQSPTRPLQNVSRRSGMERASSQPSLRAEKPKENKSNSWLAKDILNRSQHGLEGGGDRSRDGYQSRVTDPPRQMPKQKRPKADPSVSSRRDDPDDQSRHTGDSASLQMMREKHRASERKLQKAISKGKLNGSQRDHLVRKDGSTRISTSNAQW